MSTVRTISGRVVDLRAPDPATITLEDIAYALSRIPRFNGHTWGPVYTVAQHSVRVMEALERARTRPATLLLGLLHDAHEAYMGDIISPVGDVLGPAVCALKRRLQAAIEEALLGARVAAAMRATASTLAVQAADHNAYVEEHVLLRADPDASTRWVWSPRTAQVTFTTHFVLLRHDIEKRGLQ